MEIVYKRLFIGKVIPADIDEGRAQCDGFNQGAIPRLSQNDIDGCQQRLK
jgi:hypothetical protein